MDFSSCSESRRWANQALQLIHAENNRSADTHLYKLPLPEDWGISLYLKDESTHRTGSLKHRLARSLFLYGLVNGWITAETTIVEASSGSTAVSEAYFAQLLGLPFIAVMPRSTSAEKVELIEKYGGQCHFVNSPAEIYDAATRLAQEAGGHYMDQFTYAERATDWRGNNNIAESIFAQMSVEEHPIPCWIVVGAGTGGTSATIGRYLRYHSHASQLAVADPENSAFYPGWKQGVRSYETGKPSRIEGIGRPRMEPSFIPELVDQMFPVPDAASVAAMYDLAERYELKAGPSTGTNLWAAYQIIARMLANGEKGSVVTLLCDSATRYHGSYYDDAWVTEKGLSPEPYTPVIEEFFNTGRWTG